MKLVIIFICILIYVNAFSWKKCGNGVFNVTHVDVKPTRPKIGQSAEITFKGHLSILSLNPR